jgi:hypothetical protein
MQFVPFPRRRPRQPSSFHIFASPLVTEPLYSSLPAPLCTWKRIFNRSRGETTVRDTAPATPPARNAAATGSDMLYRICRTSDEVANTPSLTVLGMEPESLPDGGRLVGVMRREGAPLAAESADRGGEGGG